MAKVHDKGAAGHTPGPWSEWNAKGGRIMAAWRVDSPSAPICTVHDTPTGAQVANARMIAAAPDLAAALIRAEADLVLNMRTTPKGNAEYRQGEATLGLIRAALAKAGVA